MFSLLITILVLVIVFGLLWWLIATLPIPAQMANVRWVLYAILVLIAIVVLLRMIPGFNPGT